MKKILSIIIIIVLSTILGLAYNASTNLSLRLLEETDDTIPLRLDLNYNFELVDDIFDDVTLTEFSYLDGVTSAIQAQIDAVVDTSGTPVDNDYAKFTDANTIEGRSYSEVKEDLNLEIGTDIQAYDAGLLAIAGLTTAANDMIYTTAIDTYAIMDTFSELQAVVADKTLINEEDAIILDNNLAFEGTANDYETTFTITDPTADRAITFQDAAGIVVMDATACIDIEGLGLVIDTGTLKVDYADVSDEIAGDIAEGELADAIIVEADLKVVDSPADEDFFTFEATTGDFEWHSIADVSAGIAADIAEGELNDSIVVEDDLKVVDSPSDEDVFTYESTTGDFEWHSKAELGIGTATSITDGLIIKADFAASTDFGNISTDASKNWLIDDDTILEADLKAVNSSTDEDILTKEDTTGDFEWHTPTELGIALVGQTFYIGTTQVAINRGSGALTLAGLTLTTPNIGTPSGGTLTNCDGLPIATGVSGLAANVATFLATPSSSNLIDAVTGETGTGALVFGTSPTFTTQITTPLVTAAAALALNSASNNDITIQPNGTGDTIIYAPSDVVTTVTGTDTLTIAEAGTVLVSAGSAYTLTLPTASGHTGLRYHFVKTDYNYNLITLEGDGAETFNYENAADSAQTTYPRLNTPLAEVTIVSDGTNWQVINEAMGQVPECRVYLSAQQDNLKTNFWCNISYDTESYDIGSNYNVATWVSGTADGDVASHLQDDGESQFTEAMVGYRVQNTDSSAYAYVIAYDDAGDLELNADIFPVGNEAYEIMNSKFVAPIAGRYKVECFLTFNNTVADRRYGSGYKIGTVLKQVGYSQSSMVQRLSNLTMDYCTLSKDDEVTFWADQEGGVDTVDVSHGDSYPFAIKLISKN